MCSIIPMSLQCIAVKYYVQKLQMIVMIARRKWTIFALVVTVVHIHSICLSKLGHLLVQFSPMPTDISLTITAGQLLL